MASAFPCIAHAQEPYPIIYIQADGSVVPSTVPIQQNGSIYTFLGDVQTRGIQIQRSNITIDGTAHFVRGNGEGWDRGFLLSGTFNVTIKNLKIEEFYHGIELNSSSNTRILNTSINGNRNYGVSILRSSNDNIIEQNNITSNQFGIILGGDNNTIKKNNIASNSYGVFSGYFYEFMLGSGNKIIENSITINGVGVTLYDSSKNTIHGNNITANKFNGITLTRVSNSTISENIIAENSGRGIFLDGEEGSYGMTQYDTITRNQITSNQKEGMYFYYADKNYAEANNITSNGSDGVFLGCSSSNTLRNNNISGNNGKDIRNHGTANIISPAIAPSEPTSQEPTSEEPTPAEPSDTTSEGPPTDYLSEPFPIEWLAAVAISISTAVAVLFLHRRKSKYDLLEIKKWLRN